MLTIDQLMSQLFSSNIDDVRAAYIARVREEHTRAASLQEQLHQLGFEKQEPEHGEIIVNGTTYTQDGRVVLHAIGKKWVVSEDLHKERVRLSLAAVEQQDDSSQLAVTKSVVGTESLSAMTCSKCSDALQHTAVCPACTAGKLGYRHRYSCLCGGTDILSKEIL
jgi:hypothetical protein